MLFTSCRSTGGQPKELEGRTDFVLGRTYQLEKNVFIFKLHKSDPEEIPTLEKLGAAGTPADLAGFQLQAASNPQVVGMLSPGVQIKVVKIDETKSATVGTFLHVYATVISGDHKDTVVELCMISKSGRPSFKIFIDPDFLTEVK